MSTPTLLERNYMGKIIRLEDGVVSPEEISITIDRFLAIQHLEPGQGLLLLSELYENFIHWLEKERIPFSIPQRKFCIILVSKGFRAAYLNMRSNEKWSFRKVIFANYRESARRCA